MHHDARRRRRRIPFVCAINAVRLVELLDQRVVGPSGQAHAQTITHNRDAQLGFLFQPRSNVPKVSRSVHAGNPSLAPVCCALLRVRFRVRFLFRFRFTLCFRFAPCFRFRFRFTLCFLFRFRFTQCFLVCGLGSVAVPGRLGRLGRHRSEKRKHTKHTILSVDRHGQPRCASHSLKTANNAVCLVRRKTRHDLPQGQSCTFLFHSRQEVGRSWCSCTTVLGVLARPSFVFLHDRPWCSCTTVLGVLARRKTNGSNETNRQFTNTSTKRAEESNLDRWCACARALEYVCLRACCVLRFLNGCVRNAHLVCLLTRVTRVALGLLCWSLRLLPSSCVIDLIYFARGH